MKTLIAAIAACALITTAAAAQDETTTEQVRVNDLDLNSAQGRHILDRRISNAVTDVCQTEDGLDFDADIDAYNCRKNANRQVAIEVAHAEAAYAAATGGSAHSLAGR